MARPETLEELIWEIRRTFRELAAATDRELERMGIQAATRAFLEFLAKETEPVSLSDLARKYKVSRQHIHQTLRRLPHSAWIEEVPDTDDRRTVRLRLSPEGRKFWKKVRTADQMLLGRLSAGLPQDRVAEATKLLRQLRREVAKEKGLQ